MRADDSALRGVSPDTVCLRPCENDFRLLGHPPHDDRNRGVDIAHLTAGHTEPLLDQRRTIRTAVRARATQSRSDADKEMAMHHALPPAEQRAPDHAGIRRSSIERSAIVCLAAMLGTASWVAILGVCSWALEFSLGPLSLAAISIGIFVVHLFALSLAAGERSNGNDRDDDREAHAGGDASKHQSAHACCSTNG